MDLQNITLVSVGYIEEIFLRSVVEAAGREFCMPVTVREGFIDITEFYDPTRRQYNGSKLLKEIDTLFASDASKTIGLFSIDLFIPILTFIFGQAYLNGRSGIASYYRLSNERYGMSGNNKIIIQRFQKEVIHELGHTFGLVHCHMPTCVMRSSTYVEDIDQKDISICSHCRSILNETIPAFSNFKT
jgi:archaemetzincin